MDVNLLRRCWVLKTDIEKPVVSIIIPIYNASKYLKKCLDSIVMQSYSNFECILVDDGSTDNSEDICNGYAIADSRFKVIHQKNLGAHAARLAGYKQATGRYIGFVDSDDWIEPDMYECLVEAMSDDVDITMVCFIPECCGSPQMPGRKKWKKKVMKSQDAMMNFLTTRVIGWDLWSKLFKRELLDETVFPSEISLGDDFVTSCLVFPRANKVSYLPYDLYHYRLHPASMTHDNSVDSSLEFSKAVRMILGKMDIYTSPVCNYLLYLYVTLLVARLGGLFYNKKIPSQLEKQIYLDLQSALQQIDESWLNIKEKKLSRLILNTEINEFVSATQKRYNMKCQSFVGDNVSYIYGAGKVGKTLHKYLSHLNIKVEGFIVSEKGNDIVEIAGTRVYSINDVLDSLPNMRIFLGVSRKYLYEIRSALKKNGAKHFYLAPMLRQGFFDGRNLEKAKDRLLLCGKCNAD